MKLRLFQPDARTRSDKYKRIYAVYELWYTIIDVLAALSFFIGSALFLSEATKTIGTWLFIIGSFFFLMKPALRLIREAKFVALGDVRIFADRAGWSEDNSHR